MLRYLVIAFTLTGCVPTQVVNYMQFADGTTVECHSVEARTSILNTQKISSCRSSKPETTISINGGTSPSDVASSILNSGALAGAGALITTK